MQKKKISEILSGGGGGGYLDGGYPAYWKKVTEEPLYL